MLSHRTDAASPLSALPTAYARITDSRLAVEYEVTDSQPVVEVSADETSTTVTLRVLVSPFDPSAGQGIAPLSPVTSTVDLASPRGDRRVVDSTGSPLPEESRADLGA